MKTLAMTGKSEKQIQYAEDIRKEIIDEINDDFDIYEGEELERAEYILKITKEYKGEARNMIDFGQSFAYGEYIESGYKKLEMKKMEEK